MSIKLDKLKMLGYTLTEINNIKVYRNEDKQNLAIVVDNKEPFIKSYAGLLITAYKNKYQVFIKSTVNLSRDKRSALNIVISNDGTIYDLKDNEGVGETDTLIIMYSANVIRVFNKVTNTKSMIRVKSKGNTMPNVSYGMIELEDNKLILQNMYIDLKRGLSFYIQCVGIYEDCVLLSNDRLWVHHNGIECDLTTRINAGVHIKDERVSFLIDRISGTVYSLLEATVTDGTLYAKMYNIITKRNVSIKYNLKPDRTVEKYNPTFEKWNRGDNQ